MTMPGTLPLTWRSTATCSRSASERCGAATAPEGTASAAAASTAATTQKPSFISGLLGHARHGESRRPRDPLRPGCPPLLRDRNALELPAGAAELEWHADRPRQIRSSQHRHPDPGSPGRATGCCSWRSATFVFEGVAQPGDLRRAVGTVLMGGALLPELYAAELASRLLSVAGGLILTLVAGVVIASLAGKGPPVAGIAAIPNAFGRVGSAGVASVG